MSEQVEVKRFQIVPGMSARTSKLIELMKDGKDGDILTDESLTEIAGVEVSVGGAGYSYLQSAVRYCTNNHKLVWQRIPKTGTIKCLGPQETVRAADRDMKHAGRTARRGIKKLKTIDSQKLNVQDTTKYLTSRAQLGVIAAASSGDTTKRLSEAKQIDPEEIQKKMLQLMA